MSSWDKPSTHVEMKALLPAGLSLCLAACAGLTPQTMMEGGPRQVYSSVQNAKNVAACVGNEWEEYKVIGSSPVVANKETNVGRRVTLHIAGRLAYLADIEVTTAGSKTNLYFGGILGGQGSPNDSAVVAIIKCQS